MGQHQCVQIHFKTVLIINSARLQLEAVALTKQVFYLKNKRNGFIELYIICDHYTYSVLGEMLIRITSGHSA